MDNIKIGNYVTITERKCSDKMQPNIHIGDIFIVDKIQTTSTGIPVIEGHDVKDPKKIYRCNEKRFRWEGIDFYNRIDLQPAKGKLKVGHIIMIVARLCPLNIQREIQVNCLYQVEKIKNFLDGHVEITVKSLKKTNHILYKLSSLRFHWERLEVGQLMHSVQNEHEEKKSFQKMLTTAADTAFEREKDKLFRDFTFQEQARISYIPLILYHIAWYYALKAVKYSADHRIAETTKLSRAIKMLHERYLDYLKRDLDYEHMMQVRRQAETFMSDHQMLFTKFYFTVLNSINHQHIGISYDGLRANAFIAKIFLLYLWNFENQMTELIRQRLGSANDVHLPHQDALKDCMEAYLGNFAIDMSTEVEIGLKIFVKEIDKIEYVVKK